MPGFDKIDGNIAFALHSLRKSWTSKDQETCLVQCVRWHGLTINIIGSSTGLGTWTQKTKFHRRWTDTVGGHQGIPFTRSDSLT